MFKTGGVTITAPTVAAQGPTEVLTIAMQGPTEVWPR